MSEVLRQLSRIPLFADTPPEAFTIESLGGLTNKNHKVTVDGASYMLRIAGVGTGEYIDRKAEAVNRNPAEDFWAYAAGRFERCKALMAAPGFAGHLAAVRGG